MKRLFVLVSCVLLASGCSMYGKQETVVRAAPARVAAPTPVLVDANGARIERVEFVTGRSSVTVERMAKLKGCTGGQGAGLMTPEGPVEVYKMRCENGQTFTARCELRQCKAM
ncbi:hypothetical protein [Massilia cavernae]|uniref:Lipoprotein n=1 Tax=Massilia cavernae TaxID=2320864 RepID=A0A418Y0Z7_9BURK|nr:hypothetical protein [Massilia cavernae]RJG19096.1 hypothetical protein D3872_09075 [Massilia cavernae]